MQGSERYDEDLRIVQVVGCRWFTVATGSLSMVWRPNNYQRVVEGPGNVYLGRVWVSGE